MAKPRLLITRRLTDAVHARASRDYDTTLNMADTVFDRDALIAASLQADAVLPCHSEHFDDGVLAAIEGRVKIIANHSVGTDHVDLSAAAA
ncbi:MAG: D-glycerate dehydrogenase, partial [Pseudomonadota bacterium]